MIVMILFYKYLCYLSFYFIVILPHKYWLDKDLFYLLINYYAHGAINFGKETHIWIHQNSQTEANNRHITSALNKSPWSYCSPLHCPPPLLTPPPGQAPAPMTCNLLLYLPIITLMSWRCYANLLHLPIMLQLTPGLSIWPNHMAISWHWFIKDLFPSSPISHNLCEHYTSPTVNNSSHLRFVF